MITFTYEPGKNTENNWGIYTPVEKVTMEVDSSADLLELCDAFGQFIKACGYDFDGEIGIINENDTEEYTDPCEDCDCDELIKEEEEDNSFIRGED